MTNFVAAFHPEGALPSHLLRLDTQPRAQRVETIGESPASIAYQTVIKPIDDRILRSRASGSWVALLGTPLLPAWTGNPDGDEKFAESFFHSPAAVLRDVLDGHFVLVAYDAKNRRLYVATDYNNLIPVFYCRERTTSIFSRSDLTLALLKGPKIDPVGVTQSVALGANLEGCSRVMGITRMSSCELVTVDEHHGLKSERYWRPACEVVSTRTFDEVLDEWTSKLQAAIRAFHARSREPVVHQDLTGGEDARLVLAQVHALGIPYTIRVSGAEGDSDVRVVRRIAGQLGLPLDVQPTALIESADLLEHARAIVAGCDGYGSFFGGCQSFATKKAYPGPPMSRLRLTGSAGGE